MDQREDTEEIRHLEEEFTDVSPHSSDLSCVSLKSDQSNDRLIHFKRPQPFAPER